MRVHGKKERKFQSTGAECKLAFATHITGMSKTGITSRCAHGKPVCGVLLKRGVGFLGECKKERKILDDSNLIKKNTLYALMRGKFSPMFSYPVEQKAWPMQHQFYSLFVSLL